MIHFNCSRFFTLHFLCGFSFFRSDLYLSFLLTIFSEYLCFCISYSWNHAGTFHQVLFFFLLNLLPLFEAAWVCKCYIHFFSSFHFYISFAFFLQFFKISVLTNNMHATFSHNFIIPYFERSTFFFFLSFFTAQYMSRGSFGLGIVRDMVVNKLRWFAVTVGKFWYIIVRKGSRWARHGTVSYKYLDW